MTDKVINALPDSIRKTIVGDYGFSAADVPNLKGKVAVVTGGTNGIGLSVARTVYGHGAHVVLLSSDKQVADQAIEYIKTGDVSKAPADYAEGFKDTKEDTSGDAASPGGEVEWLKCDNSDLEEVARVGKALSEKLDRLDYFFGIAGIGVAAFSQTKHGYDSHLTINCLAQQLLLSHLWPIIEKTAQKPGADVRVLTMSSELHRADFSNATFADVQEFKKDVGPLSLYSRTKLGNILLAKAVSQRHNPAANNILVFATHPGGVRTGQQDQFKSFAGKAGEVAAAVVRPAMRNPDKGAASALWAAFSQAPRDPKEGWKNGDYISNPDEDGKENSAARDQNHIDNFYDNSERIIVGIVGKENYGGWSK